MTRIIRNVVRSGKCNSSVKLCNVRLWVVLCTIHPYAHISFYIGSLVCPRAGGNTGFDFCPNGRGLLVNRKDVLMVEGLPMMRKREEKP